MTWKLIESAPKDGTRILVKEEVEGEPYITAWTNDAYELNGGMGGPAGWFSGNYYDYWHDRPSLDEPKFWMELPR